MKRVYLLCGPSLAGKTTVCAAMVERLGVAPISSDEINAERGLPFGGEGLPERVWAETLAEELRRLERLLAEERSIVVDDTNCYRWLRDRIREAAARHGYETMVVHLAAEASALRARRASLARSGDRPVLSAASFQRHLATFEPPGEDEPTVTLSTAEDVARWLGEEERARRGRLRPG